MVEYPLKNETAVITVRKSNVAKVREELRTLILQDTISEELKEVCFQVYNKLGGRYDL